jgi:hypothetical protein
LCHVHPKFGTAARPTIKNGGRKTFEIALDQLAKDPIRYAVVIGAFFPDMMRALYRFC